VPGIPAVLRSAALELDYRDLAAEELLRTCADLRDRSAWDELIHRFHGLIYGAVLRTGRRYERFPRDLCDDLVQETYVRLAAHGAKALRDFVPRQPGSAFRYLQVIAIRVTQDACKKKDFQRIEELPADPPDRFASDKTEWLALKAQIDDILRRHATLRDCQIFRLHYLHGMTAKEIAGIGALELTVKGVESALLRLTRLIQENLGEGKRESSG